MIIGITGTPGTGKTSITKYLEKQPGLQVIHLNEIIKEEKLYSEKDEERDCVVADMELVYSRVLELADSSCHATIVDSHLSHHIADIVIVLRTSPEILGDRLKKRNYSDAKIKENLEAEALDIILAESVEWCEKVFEVNTSSGDAVQTLGIIRSIIQGILNGDTKDLEEEYRPGMADWSDYLFD